MISIDAVRTAAFSDLPWSRLDAIVRGEMATGRKVKDILTDYATVLDQVRETPGLSEDAEDALLDTLDSLTGNCRADQRYVDPPNSTLPTEEEIAKLPRWARVAFAARCARRVLPLYRHYRSHPEHRIFIQDPEWSVRIAEESAANGRSHTDASIGYEEAASVVYEDENPADEAAHNATNAAAYAAADAGDNNRPARAWFAMNYALAASKPLVAISSLVRRDFDQLAQVGCAKHWDDSTPVPPEVFGPLWPEGPPKGWPVDPDARKHTDIALEVVNGDGLEERVVEDDVVNLFNAMNRYHIARGGQPLSLEDFQPLISALVPAGV